MNNIWSFYHSINSIRSTSASMWHKLCPLMRMRLTSGRFLERDALNLSFVNESLNSLSISPKSKIRDRYSHFTGLVLFRSWPLKPIWYRQRRINCMSARRGGSAARRFGATDWHRGGYTEPACVFVTYMNKKAVLPQGNRAMPQVFLSVEVRQQHSLQV